MWIQRLDIKQHRDGYQVLASQQALHTMLEEREEYDE